MGRRAPSEEAVARALVRAIDAFTERMDGELVDTDLGKLHQARQLAEDFTHPAGYVGATGPG